MAAMMIVLGAVAYGLAARVWSPPGGLFGFSALEVVGWNLDTAITAMSALMIVMLVPSARSATCWILRVHRLWAPLVSASFLFM